MPREAACRNCAEKKVGCKPSQGVQACQRCVERNLHCERPRSIVVHIDSEKRKTSCNECRIRRVKCERQDVNATSCFNCYTKGYTCSLDPQMPAASASSTTPTSNGPGGSSTPSESASEQGEPTAGDAKVVQQSNWFKVVLSPSSQ
ncbi:hypothetical protein GY45DRAFT_874915 [Cubamyces sp. BRFM 1775]|nr:hypothetical protein GY45DRAFT_874915 [Cubamyces sp. BRFM 1775]